jgi:hypothetical protein
LHKGDDHELATAGPAPQDAFQKELDEAIEKSRPRNWLEVSSVPAVAAGKKKKKGKGNGY